MLKNMKQKLKLQLENLIIDEKNKICKSKINNLLFCKIISYTYHYHKAIAITSQLSVKSVKMLEDKSRPYIQRMCEVDEDQETMFKLMETLRPLGIRDKNTKFDIVFPSRNQLKLYLARLIAKQRKQLRQGFLDDDSTEPYNRKTILSSTEFMEDKVISQQSMSLYASQLGIKHKSPREPTKK